MQVRSFHPVVRKLAVAFVLFFLGQQNLLSDANIYQQYYIPGEESVITDFNRILYSSTGDEIRTVVSISVVLGGTLVYLDQNEDGFEADITKPLQPTTAVWGDGDASNGIPPGFATDVLSPGDVIALDQTYDVTTTASCSNLTNCRINGGTASVRTKHWRCPGWLLTRHRAPCWRVQRKWSPPASGVIPIRFRLGRTPQPAPTRLSSGSTHW